MTKINWQGVLDRLVESTGAKNPRELDELVDAPTNYSYQIANRGMSKGYMEKVLNNFSDIDLNYVIKGERSNPTKDPIRDLIIESVSDKELAGQLATEYDDAVGEHRGSLSDEQYYQEILRFVLRLISASLEKESD